MPTILVADDNSNIQKMVANALKEKGIEVIGVANGEAAVKKLAVLNPDMVLADVFMPVRDGYELCEWIKANDRLAAVPVFLLVGAFDPLDEHRVQAVKADGVLKKPFVPTDHLIGAVSAMLDRVAKSRAAAEMQSTHTAFASSVPRVEDTQKLSDAEVAEITGQGAPASAPPPPPPPMPLQAEPEPEMDMYSTRPARLSFDEAEQPLGYDDVLGSPASADDAGGEPSDFRGFAEQDSPGIVEEMRQPTPDEPPIKVDFGGNGGADLELITSENPEGMASYSSSGAASSLPELVGSGDIIEPAPNFQAPISSAPAMDVEVAIPEVRIPEPEAEPEPAAAPMGMASSELHGLAWSEPTPAAPETSMPAPEPAWPATTAPAPTASVPEVAAPAGTPELMPRAMSLSQAQQDALVDEIVDRVVSQIQPMVVHRVTSEIGKGLEMLQPQLLERITKEVIRPLAEDIFRKKTES